MEVVDEVFQQIRLGTFKSFLDLHLLRREKLSKLSKAFKIFKAL